MEASTKMVDNWANLIDSGTQEIDVERETSYSSKSVGKTRPVLASVTK